MRFIITGRNIDVTDGLRSAVEEKLGKLDRFFAPETEVNVTLSVEKERQKIEVTIPVKGNIIRSEQVSSKYVIGIMEGSLWRNGFTDFQKATLQCGHYLVEKELILQR